MRTSNTGNTSYSLNLDGWQIQGFSRRLHTAAFGKEPKIETFIFSDYLKDSFPKVEKAEIARKIISQDTGWL